MEGSQSRSSAREMTFADPQCLYTESLVRAPSISGRTDPLVTITSVVLVKSWSLRKVGTFPFPTGSRTPVSRPVLKLPDLSVSGLHQLRNFVICNTRVKFYSET